MGAGSGEANSFPLLLLVRPLTLFAESNRLMGKTEQDGGLEAPGDVGAGDILTGWLEPGLDGGL